MTTATMGDLLARYRENLRHLTAGPANITTRVTDGAFPFDPSNAYAHILWMLDEMERDVNAAGGQMTMDGQACKLNRWLGFIQGVLWARGRYSVNELRMHVRAAIAPRPPRQHKCYICWLNDDTNTPAVRLCKERGEPVCEKHARGCDDDGHGTSALDDDY